MNVVDYWTKSMKTVFISNGGRELLEQQDIDQLVWVKLLSYLKLLTLHLLKYSLFRLMKILEYSVSDARKVIDWNKFPRKLVNFQRFTCYEASLDYIMALISWASKLSLIRIKQRFCIGTYFNRNTDVIVDVEALNNERRKLKGARKLTIFWWLMSLIYLAKIWAFGETNFN